MDELLGVPDAAYAMRVGGRLVLAALLGGLIGAEREWVGKAAGLRTHMTVALGSATFILIAVENGAGADALSRAIQGIAAGIGFIGAGTILKRGDEAGIQGLTTAATIWLTAGVGAAAGAGHGGLAAGCVLAAWIILTTMNAVERWMERKKGNSAGS